MRCVSLMLSIIMLRADLTHVTGACYMYVWKTCRLHFISGSSTGYVNMIVWITLASAIHCACPWKSCMKPIEIGYIVYMKHDRRTPSPCSKLCWHNIWLNTLTKSFATFIDIDEAHYMYLGIYLYLILCLMLMWIPDIIFFFCTDTEHNFSTQRVHFI